MSINSTINKIINGIQGIHQYLVGGTVGTIIGNTGSSLSTDDVARISGVYTELTVGTSAVELKVGATMLTDRKYVVIRPKDSSVYYGYNNSVTTTTGTEVFRGEFLMLPIGVPVWLIASGAGKKVSIGELS